MECKSDLSIMNPWTPKFNLRTLINQHIVDNVSKVPIEELAKHFGSLYIVSINHMQSKNFIFEKKIDDEQYEYIKNKLVVRQIPFSLLKNNVMLNLLNILYEKDYPSHYINNKGINCNFETTSILTISSLYVSDSAIDNFIKQYDGISSLHSIIQMFIVNDYFQKDTYSSQNKIVRSQMINNMNEANYWVLSSNCKLNITLKFIARGFTFSTNNRLESKEVKKILEKISLKSEEDHDYLSHIFKKQDYVDASATINKEGYKLYRISKNEDMILREDFNNLLEGTINRRELYYLLTNMLVSKDYCHLIINNENALNKLVEKDLKFEKDQRSLLQKYTPIFAYLWSYAWLTMYLEESIKKTRIDESDRFVFDLDTASKLPYFPMSPEEPNKCPYLPLLVKNNVLAAEENVLGVHNYILKDHNFIQGVISQDKFIERLNIFISGSSEKKYLEDVNWKNIAVSGSIMAACVPRFNPLMLNFCSNYVINYNEYFNEYYKDADIDVMCNLKKFEFIDKVYEFGSKIEENIKKNNGLINDEISCLNINYVKTGTVFVNKEFIIKYILPEAKMSYPEIALKLHDKNIKKLFYPWYIKQKIIDNKAEIDTPQFFNEKYIGHFEICSEDNFMVVITKKWDIEENTKSIKPIKQTKFKSKSKSMCVNDSDDEILSSLNNINDDSEDDDKEVKEVKEIESKDIDEGECLFKANENLKFRISSKYLGHNFELFSIRYDSFFSTVANFHLPIVRGYFNGLKTFILPSCISACMTMMNFDYKYFAGAKDPIEIINKYRMRGFGTYLNDKEKIKMIEYSSLVEKWNKLYGKINIKNNNSVKKIFGLKDITDLFFKPSLVLKHIIVDYEGHNYSSFMHSKYNINAAYKCLFGGEYSNIRGIQQSIYNTTCINDNGYIEPMRKWLICACYEAPIKAYNNSNDN